MKKIIFLIFSIVALFLVIQPVSAANWTYNYDTSGYSYDLVNSTGFRDWMYYMIVTNASPNNWNVPVIGFSYSIMLPFLTAFSGFGVNSGAIVYVILFGLLILMSWRNSGRVSIPLMIAALVGGGFAMIMPESAIPIMLVLFCAAAASLLFTWFSKEG